jgi:hypothetical protein
LQDPTITKDETLKIHLKVIAISKVSITRQAINYNVVGKDEKLA